MQSIAWFAIPFSVESHFVGKFGLNWKGFESRIVWVDMKGYDEDFGILYDKNSFEML